MDKELFNYLDDGNLIKIQDLYQSNPPILLEVTFQGDSALHIAARKGHLHLVTWIFKLNPALAGAKNKDENTPLHEAAKSRNADIVRILLPEQRYVSHFNKFGETALIIASQYGHVETVRLLLRARSSQNAFEWDRSVREAAYRGYRDVVVEMLDNPIKPLANPTEIEANVVVEMLDNPNIPPANPAETHDAPGFSNLNIPLTPTIPLTPIIPATPTIPLTPTIPATPILHTAVQGGHLEIVKAILNHGSWQTDWMTSIDGHGRCTIHVAAMKGHWNIIDEFMSRWPDCVEIRSSDHKSVLHFAVEYNQLKVVQKLLAGKKKETVKELVSRDHDSLGNTSLHLAALKGVNPQIVEYLVSLPGVDVNALNNDGMTALDIASAAQHNPNCAIIVHTAGGKRNSDPSNDSKQEGDKDTMNTHMVVASLIATVTFAAIFQIPGGIEEDDSRSIHYGGAKLAFSKLFKLFIFSDTMAFSSSLAVVLVRILRQHLSTTKLGGRSMASFVCGVSLPVSIVWTMVAFVSAAIIVVKPRNFETLKSKDKKAFDNYTSLFQCGLLTISTPPLLVCSLSFLWVWKPRIVRSFSPFQIRFQFIFQVFGQIFLTTFYIIFFVLA